MTETVSVDEAIKKGVYTVNLPALLIFIFGLIIAFVLAFVFILPFAMIFVIFGTIVIAIVYRGFTASKWRLWAFENVRNVHELQQRAVSSKLVAVNNRPGFGLIDFSSAAQKERWEQLQVKFKQPDIFTDDPTVPPETVIRYSKLRKLLWTVFYLAMVCMGISLFFTGSVGPDFFGAMLIGGGGWLTYSSVKDAFNRTPQIIINDKGIITATTRFYSWKEISNEKILVQGGGKSVSFYLCYDTPTGSVKYTLDNFDTGTTRLEQLLRVYRGRSVHGIV